jgi:peptide deformylase
MQTLKISKYPEDILRNKAEPIEEVTEAEKGLFAEMLLTMKQASGIGLAAPQVGINKRLFVVDLGEGHVIKLANPRILKVNGSDQMEEGCLSVPGAVVKVKRPTEIVVRGLNENGKMVEIKATGLLARVILHEIDHLNGKLIIDYMNLLQRIKYKVNERQQGRI